MKLTCHLAWAQPASPLSFRKGVIVSMCIFIYLSQCDDISLSRDAFWILQRLLFEGKNKFQVLVATATEVVML